MSFAGAVTRVGGVSLDAIRQLGGSVLLALEALWVMLRPPHLSLRQLLRQCSVVGVQSIPVVAITGTFTGMVLAYQSAIAFRHFGAEELIGTVVSLSLVRELGPVLAGVMVAGRVGSAMAAELGTMRVTEQIDALVTLATNPVRYLVLPRILAATIMLPCLVMFTNLLGILGGAFVAIGILGTNPSIYEARSLQYLDLEDLGVGLTKAAVFGASLALIGCYYGYTVQGGAREVGRAVTRSVVVSLVAILIFDYLITVWFFG